MSESVNVVFRTAHSQDIQSLCLIEKNVFRFDQFNKKQFNYLVTQARSYCIIAEQDKKAVGYAMVLFRENSTICRLYSIALLETSRGSGIAKKLLEHLTSEAIVKKCRMLSLEVRKGNIPAIQFYLREGFFFHQLLSNYYEDGEDALQMRKIIFKES